MLRQEEGDALGKELQGIEQWAKEHDMTLVPGWIESEDRFVTVHWATDESSESLRNYLALGHTSGAKFVVFDVTRLTLEDWESARERVIEAGQSVDELQACKDRISQVAAIRLGWLAPGYQGVAFMWDDEASWSEIVYPRHKPATQSSLQEEQVSQREELSEDEVEALAAQLSGDADFQRAAEHRDCDKAAKRVLPSSIVETTLYNVVDRAAEMVEAELKRDAQVRDMIARLANDPRFQRAKNKGQKRHAAEQVLGAAVAGHERKLRFVVNQATIMFEVDLRKTRGPRH